MRYSAGLLVHRDRDGAEVLLVHPGGPYWANKDEHAWSVPKGEYDPDTEDPYETAIREFVEELGRPVPEGEPVDLGSFRQNSGKTIRVWSIAGEVDVRSIESNTFEIEWPPRSGTMRRFPEVDRAEWFHLDEARTKIHKGQLPMLEAFAALPSP